MKKRKLLQAKVSKDQWIYESFAMLEVDSKPYRERSWVIIRRNSWLEKIFKKYGPDFFDTGTTDGNQKHALQPAHDGLYIT